MRCIAAALLCLVPLVAEAKQSPYPPVTQFNGDRYASAQLGPEVTRSMGCPPPACQRGNARKARYLYPTRKRPPVSRKRWHDVPIPAPRPLAAPGATEPLSMTKGMWREARRVIAGRPQGCPARAWCGCWLARHLGMVNRALWLARNWAHVGSNIGRPVPGAIVVWRHHVGKITAVAGNRIRVLSGNDGRAVRERWRSTAGVIAYRSSS